MSELEEKLGNVLNNPQLMQQIMSMAQSLGNSQQNQPSETQKEESAPTLDPGLIQKLTTMATSGTMDSNQQTLLHALSPYLSHQRISKLERAMQAARMAGAASAFLNAGGLQMLTGR